MCNNFRSIPESVLEEGFEDLLRAGNVRLERIASKGHASPESDPTVFRRLPAPHPQALAPLIQTMNQRVGAFLEREGLLVWDIENTYLQLETSDESALNDFLDHSVTYCIAIGPQAGRKASTLQTVPAREEDSNNSQLAKTAGFCSPLP